MIEQRVELQAPVFRWLRLLLIVLKDKCRVLCRPVLVGLCRSVQHSAQAYKAQSSLCALFWVGGTCRTCCTSVTIILGLFGSSRIVGTLENDLVCCQPTRLVSSLDLGAIDRYTPGCDT